MRLLLLFAVAFLVGCDSSEPDDPTPKDTLITQLDLRVGTVYTYTLTTTISDTAGVVSFQEIDTLQVHIAAENETLGERTDLIRLDITQEEFPEWTARSWYRNTEGALQDIAYQNPGLGSPLLLKTGQPTATWPLFFPQTAPADTAIVIRDITRFALQYPLEAGSSWEVFNEGVFRQTRTVSDSAPVMVRAGTFNCTSILTVTTQPATNDDWSIWVAEEGLIQSTFRSTSQVTGPNGVPTGKIQVFDQQVELIDLTVPVAANIP